MIIAALFTIIMVLAQVGLSAALFAWPAFHVMKRWGVGGLVGLWINASLIGAWIYQRAVTRRIVGMGVAPEDGPQVSFWGHLPMALLVFGSAALVVYWRVRKGDVRFSTLLALRSGVAMLIGLAIFMTVSFVVLAP